MLSALVGYSAIDAKRLGRAIKKAMRENGKSYEIRWKEAVELIDDALFDLDYQRKKKQLKGGIKKNG